MRWQVDTAEDGAQALRATARVSYDAVRGGLTGWLSRYFNIIFRYSLKYLYFNIYLKYLLCQSRAAARKVCRGAARVWCDAARGGADRLAFAILELDI